MVKSASFCIVLLVLSTTLFAQSDYRKGYVITLEGDTLHGEIDYRGDRRMANVCSFRLQKDSPKQDFAPDQIGSYRFQDGKYFVAKELDGQKYFFEYLIKGRLNIYYLRDDNSRYYIEKEGGEFIELPYEKEVRAKVEEEGKYYMYESVKHKGILAYFTEDAPALQADILKIAEPSHSSLIKIGEKYHNMVCDDEKCIVYEKKRVIKTSIEALGGLNFYNRTAFYGGMLKRNYFNGGVLVHLNMPSENENLYLRTGLLYTRIGYYTGEYVMSDSYDDYTKYYITEESNLLKIPIQFEYIFGKDMLIKPKFAGGLNVYTKKIDITLGFMAGVNIRLSKSYYWSVNYDIDFNSDYLVVPKRLFSHGVSTGLYYQF